MKKMYVILLLAAVMLITSACSGRANARQPEIAQTDENQTSAGQSSVEELPRAEDDQAASDRHILVAYLSRSGENYHVGVPKEGSASAAYAGYVEKGNTAILAKVIAQATGGDLFAITTVTPYPDDYETMLQVAQEELDTDARPELAGSVENMADYDVIFIGYPIWHGHLPQAIYSFMESYDLNGKTVIPFNTHEGSGQAGTQRIIENALPGSTVLQGLAVQGKTAQEEPEKTKALVDEWLGGLDLNRANSDEAAALAAYEAVQQAMIDKDIETLDQIILDGTTFTHMSGKTQTKEEYFADIRDGRLDYQSYTMENTKIVIDGDEATLTSRVVLTANAYGAQGSWPFNVTAHLVRIDGEWRLTN